jgi:hypothetical protein
MAITSAPSPTPQSKQRSGAVTFAGVIVVLAGAMNLLDGIVALVNGEYFRVESLLFGDITAWGVFWLFSGVLLLFSGWLILRRSTFGVVYGVTVAGLNALAQLMFLSAYPAWSVAAIVVDGLIIWALTAHIDEFL